MNVFKHIFLGFRFLSEKQPPRTYLAVLSGWIYHECIVHTASYTTWHEKEFFWSIFSRIYTEYGEILPISLYSVQIRKNPDQKNSEYGHFPGSAKFLKKLTASDNF